MAYTKTNWVAGVTPLSEANMDHLETQYDEVIAGGWAATDDIAVLATKKYLMDGAGGHSYLYEKAADVVALVVGGVEAVTFTEATTVTAAFSGGASFGGDVSLANTMSIKTGSTDSDYLIFKAVDNDGAPGAYLEIGRLVSADNPYFAFGGSQEFKFYNGGTAGFTGRIDFTGQTNIGNSVDFQLGHLVSMQPWSVTIDQYFLIKAYDVDGAAFAEVGRVQNANNPFIAFGGGQQVKVYNSGLITLENSYFIKEQAAAATDIAAYGQFWVKNDTPNTPWFTDDAGSDIPLKPILGTAIADEDGTLSVAAGATVNKVNLTAEKQGACLFTIDGDGHGDIDIEITIDGVIDVHHADGTESRVYSVIFNHSLLITFHNDDGANPHDGPSWRVFGNYGA